MISIEFLVVVQINMKCVPNYNFYKLLFIIRGYHPLVTIYEAMCATHVRWYMTKYVLVFDTCLFVFIMLCIVVDNYQYVEGNPLF